MRLKDASGAVSSMRAQREQEQREDKEHSDVGAVVSRRF